MSTRQGYRVWMVIVRDASSEIQDRFRIDSPRIQCIDANILSYGILFSSLASPLCVPGPCATAPPAVDSTVAPLLSGEGTTTCLDIARTTSATPRRARFCAGNLAQKEKLGEKYGRAAGLKLSTIFMMLLSRSSLYLPNVICIKHSWSESHQLLKSTAAMEEMMAQFIAR